MPKMLSLECFHIFFYKIINLRPLLQQAIQMISEEVINIILIVWI